MLWGGSPRPLPGIRGHDFRCTLQEHPFREATLVFVGLMLWGGNSSGQLDAEEGAWHRGNL
eukprot:16446692-Heterocapsa_arctica.AAC.1